MQIRKKKRIKLFEARKRKKLSQEEVAKVVCISRSFYNQIENGERNPRYETTVKISNFLEVDVREWK
jgi:transcriptional regulator with XRE-family HTH domain